MLLEVHPDKSRAADLGVSLALESDSTDFLRITLERLGEDRDFINKTLCLVIMDGTREMFDLLMDDYKADPNAVHLQSALMMAMHQGRPAMGRVLVDRGADINYLHEQSDNIAETALHSAIYYAPELVEWLLEQGADPNLCHEGSFTPLMRAADKGRENTVTTLLKAGADPNVINNDGNSALHVAQNAYNPSHEVIRLLSQNR